MESPSPFKASSVYLAIGAALYTLWWGATMQKHGDHSGVQLVWGAWFLETCAFKLPHGAKYLGPFIGCCDRPAEYSSRGECKILAFHHARSATTRGICYLIHTQRIYNFCMLHAYYLSFMQSFWSLSRTNLLFLLFFILGKQKTCVP